MSQPPEENPRVAVRSAEVVATHGSHAMGQAFDEHGEYRDVLVRSLIRAQFGLTLSFIALVVGVLISIPLVVALVPSLSGRHIFGLPFALAVLGVAVYPALVIFAIVYVRLAERTERHFLDLVDKL